MRRRRDGFSLIELTVVLTVLSLVWLSITCVLYTLYRADHRLRDDLQREHALDRFAMRLRLDAHAASSANLLEVAEGGNELVLSTVDERSIHYGMSDEGVYRVVQQGEAVLHRDKFLTGRDQRVGIAIAGKSYADRLDLDGAGRTDAVNSRPAD